MTEVRRPGASGPRGRQDGVAAPPSGAPKRIDQTLEDLGPQVAAEVRRVLADSGLHDIATVPIDLEKLHHGHVLRARVAGDGPGGSVVLKRLDPRAAQRNRLVVQRWLPWLGLDGVVPTLLAAAAVPGVESVWQIYEDVGGEALGTHQADRKCIAAAVDLIAEIHTRAAGHPVVSECRRYGEDFGIHYLTSNVRDALSLLKALRPPVVTPKHEALRDRLRQRLERLLESAPRRAGTLADGGGPDTLLHGDLWAANILVLPGGERPRLRVIDWDHVGAGPITYDLSFFLSRFPAPDRPWILDRYRDAVAGAGWRLPEVPDLNLLFETAECARCANRIIWPAIAILHDRTEWGFVELAEVEQWFEALEPVLPV